MLEDKGPEVAEDEEAESGCQVMENAYTEAAEAVSGRARRRKPIISEESLDLVKTTLYGLKKKKKDFGTPQQYCITTEPGEWKRKSTAKMDRTLQGSD